MSKNKITLEELSSLIDKKITNKEKNSYSYKLAKDGIEKITRKIGEEALEVIIASFIHNKDSSIKSRNELINEVCDLFYHSLVLLTSQQIKFDEILMELYRRNRSTNSS